MIYGNTKKNKKDTKRQKLSRKEGIYKAARAVAKFFTFKNIR